MSGPTNRGAANGREHLPIAEYRALWRQCPAFRAIITASRKETATAMRLERQARRARYRGECNYRPAPTMDLVP